MPPTYLPLRWESNGDQWWFASPIDCAAANGYYDLVKHFIHIEPNLLITLTSLPRIQRLETLWDDDHNNFNEIAKCRSQIAQKLLQEFETNTKDQNPLIRAGYGGWLLYTAASAGDIVFVKELLERDPLLVFGEGEYGVTDILYAAASGKSCEVFRALFDHCVSYKRLQLQNEVSSVFRDEMINRAVYAAARGGNVEMLKELLGEGCDILAYRDAKEFTVLHSASGRGRVEVVKDLISTYDIINSVDNEGNTALHIAAYRGHLPVMEVLISTSPNSASLKNNHGDTFLHMAVFGFCSSSFKRFDHQKELMKKLVCNQKLLNLEEIVNVQNNDGRTPLHVAIIENIQSDIVELLISFRYIDLNLRDANGNTALDLLKQKPRFASSEILIKRLVSAGGTSYFKDRTARYDLTSDLRKHGIGGSPGTSFRIPDADMFSFSGIDDLCSSSRDLSSTEHDYPCEIESNAPKYKKLGSMNRLKSFLSWRGKKGQNSFDLEENHSMESYYLGSKNRPISLRERFSRRTSLPNNKRIMAVRCNLSDPSTRKKFAIMNSVLPIPSIGLPSSLFSELYGKSTVSADQSGNNEVGEMKMKKHGSFNLKLMNNYFCFGAQGLAVKNSLNFLQKTHNQRSLVCNE